MISGKLFPLRSINYSKYNQIQYVDDLTGMMACLVIRDLAPISRQPGPRVITAQQTGNKAVLLSAV